MHALYALVSGPLVWLAVVLFIGGSLYRLISMAWLARSRDPLVYAYFRPWYALRSILHWLVPFGATNWRRHPVMTLVTFAFHISLFAAPLFLFAHMALVRESWGVSWWYLPDGLADGLTLVVLGACVFFAWRRLTQPHVRYLTSPSDWGLLLLVAAPFATGFWAYHGLPGAATAGILHMFSGELMLAAIPFTRLSHMLFFPFTRGYMGSEFGAVRMAKDW
jgi:nitrate reductase gamma subunit